MFALVFWRDERSYGVVPFKSIVTSSGDNARVRWRRKTYAAKILAQCDDLDWLASLLVNTDGIIVGRSLDHDIENLAQGAELEERAAGKIKTVEITENAPEIFNNGSRDNTIDDDDDTEVGNVIERSMIDNVNGTAESDAESTPMPVPSTDDATPMSVPSTDDATPMSVPSTDDATSDATSIPVPSADDATSDLAVEDVAAVVAAENRPMNDQIVVHEYGGVPKIQLIDGIDVLIPAMALHDIKTNFKDNPKRMVGELMKAIVGTSKLRESTPMGKGRFDPIPEIIMKTVQRFVFETFPENLRITHREFRRCVTQMCTNLRR